jgi:predicted permease
MIGLNEAMAAVLPVFCLAAVGVVLRKVEWLTEEADNSLLRVVVNVLTPCLILDKVLGNEALRQPANLLVPPLVGFCGILIGIGLCWLVRKRVGLDLEPEQRTFALVTGLQNYGYVPFPLILTLFAAHRDTPGVLFVHNLGVDVAMWTVGLMTLGHASGWREWRKLLNPPIVAILLSLLLNVVHAQSFLPKAVLTTASMLGACAFPLGIVLTGATMADQTGVLHSAQSAKTIAWSSVFRLGLIPLALLGFAKVLPVSLELKRVLVVQAAMPAGVFPIILSRLYGGNPATAVQIVIGTSVIGLLTIPLWIQFGMRWLEIFP